MQRWNEEDKRRGLSAGTEYHFTVRAENAVGPGVPVTTDEFTTLPEESIVGQALGSG